MAKENPHRIEVTIQPSTTKQEAVELDYRLFVTGNYSGLGEGEAHKDGEIKDRPMHIIKGKKDFKKTLEDINPQLEMQVPNKIAGTEDATLDIKLDIKSMEDFHPDKIAEKVEPMKDLLEQRETLKKLKMELLRDPVLKKLIEDALKAGDIDKLMEMLGASESAKETKGKDKG